MLNIQQQVGLPTDGKPAQPKYDPNIQQNLAQPVYGSTDDIMDNINLSNEVPAVAPQSAGVGALVADTPTDNVGVEQQALLTPEQIISNQQEYNRSTEAQIATPSTPPSMFNERGEPSQGILKTSLQEQVESVAAPENNLQKINYDADDAAALINFGNTLVNRFNVKGSAWAEQLGNVAPLQEEARVSTQPILTVAGANLLHGINNRKFLNTMNTIEDAKTDFMDDYDTDIGAEKEIPLKNRIDNPVKEVFESGEPMLNQMVTSVTDDMIRLSTPEGQTPSSFDVQRTRDNAMTFIKDLTDQGQIKWARSKKGKVIPLLGDQLTLNMASAAKIANVYDVSSRSSVITSLKAPKFPAMTESVLSDSVKKVFMDKKGSVKSTNAAETFMQLQGSIPIGVNPVLYSMQQKMYNSLTKGIDNNSPFQSTLSELDPVYKEKLIKKHGNEKAQKIIQQKMGQLKKEMDDIQVRSTENMPSYLITKQSPATLRYFHISNNLSIMNQKGTTRTSFNFEGTQPIRIDNNSGLWSLGAPAVVSEARKIYLETKGLKGISRGQAIQRKLYNLKSSDPAKYQALNFYYNLGAQMAKHIDPASAKNFSRSNLNNKPLSKWVPLDYINFGSNNLSKASVLGKQLIDSNNNNTLDDFASNNPWMTEKGEWQYPSSVLIDAYQISVTPQGQHIRLQNMMESDARQSNAGLISIIIGDSGSAEILGLIPDILDDNAEMHGSLREKIYSSIDQDIELTFSSVDDGPYKQVWANLFNSLTEARGEVGAAKDYSRGLVVAGLYGKIAQKMYSEAEDFFSKINKAAVNNPKLNEAWAEVRATYAGDIMRMLNDMTDLYTYSMEKHMSKLNGYQTAMRALGTAMAAINAPSTITNMFGGTQQLSASNISPELERSVNDQVVDGLNIKTDRIAGMNIPRGTIQTDYAGAADARLEGEELYQYRPGTKQRNSWPVDVIQGGDSTIMTLAMLAMNSPDGGFKGNPVQAIAIHDALITGAEGHLIAINAYNNIAIPAFAEQAPSMMSKVVNTYNERLNEVKDKYGKTGANIGTRFLGEENNNNSFHGLTGYFDKMYDNVYGADSQAIVEDPDLSIDNNRTSTMFEPYQLARSESKREGVIRSNLRNKAILEAAGNHNWLPPTESNAKDREFNRIEGKDLLALIDIMRGSSGLLYRGEQAHPSLKAAYRKLPSNIKPSKNSMARHNIKYGKGSTLETSGLLNTMTKDSSVSNNVINQLVGASNEITHMVPA